MNLRNVNGPRGRAGGVLGIMRQRWRRS